MRLRDATVLLMALSLSACAGSGGTKSSALEEPSSRQKAAELQVQLGQGYLQQGKLDIARDKLQKALQLDPESVHANTMLGVLNERIARPELAEKFYRRAVELAPEDGEVNNNLGAFLCGAGRPAEADAWFGKALNDPYYKSPTVALANAGVCAQKVGNGARAQDYFRRVLELQPGNEVALYELARLNLEAGDYLRASAFQQRLESAVSNAPEVLELGATIEAKLGNAKVAADYRERLKRDFPDYESSYNEAASRADTGQQQQ
ncbi:MAG: type IV pilus biogenesis/stability protein PilW [Lysobacteraceae bacterium]